MHTMKKIHVPASLHTCILQWHHTTLKHPEIQRMEATLKENFHWPRVDAAIEALVKTGETCQKCKLTAVKKYGKILLPALTKLVPWEEVHVDLIGPWDVCYNSNSIQGKGTIKKFKH
jgi:hypothetical protein